MSALPVSVIVVSRGRAADLPLCLLGISQLDYPAFEVILVADPDGIAAARTLPFFDDLKTVPYDEANISAARNLGIAEAAGDIVAFIDDDAVPEPTWLTYLVAGFSDPEVACAGGFVRGRNGISFQWRARSVDGFGETAPLELDETRITVLTPQPNRAIKTEGTNMALRRDVIAGMGGFDPVYRFYLDETDVNMRLARGGHRTAIVPMAQVHHGYNASATRRGDRVPRDLFEIGASLALYLNSYGGTGAQAALARARDEQRLRALRYMVSGGLEPREVRRLLARFDAGVQAGMARARMPLLPIPRAISGFAPMPARFFADTQIFASRPWRRRVTLAQAAASVEKGVRASLFCFSPNARPHRVRFDKSGVWIQSGGLFGQSVRKGRRIRVISFKKRLAQEVDRIAVLRGILKSGKSK